MALDMFHYVYGIDTSCFYTNEETRIARKLTRLRELKDKVKKRSEKCSDSWKDWYKNLSHDINKTLKETKEYLTDKMNNQTEPRNLRVQSLSEMRKVSIFSSELTRCFGLVEDDINESVMIIKVFYFPVCEQIIRDGFYYRGKKYVYFSSSAGQIRTKKMVCVNEEFLKKHWNTLTCGLTVEKINKLGGMNINKYLAYLALCNSATDVWENFDIDRCIVVDDFETLVDADVDYINDITYEIKRQRMGCSIPHTDGCGIISPELFDRNSMFRLPWFKGLLGVCDFKRFVSEHGCSPVVKDIYGKEYDIFKDNIQVIFTKSQFKMNKFFSSWDEYKDNFKKYGCHACLCNTEEDEFNNATINYQMIQSLVDCTNEELVKMTQKSADDIRKIAKDKNTMLKALGVTKGNYNKNGYQKCLELYPELLGEAYSRTILREMKNSMEKDMWSAKFEVNGKYTFILPDLYAFCEWLFLKEENPKGLLADGEVYCSLYKTNNDVCCLRSPHLYQEWAIRKNVEDDKVKEWFVTKALYVSVHDVISRILQFDVDGDKSLVIQDKLITDVARRNMVGIVPLYYEAKKAKAELLDSAVLYKGLSAAFTGGNIGIYSNDISKIKNSPNFADPEKRDEALKCIKWLCMENNYVIDYSKTLYKSTRPDDIDEIIKSYTKAKLPAFFEYAKDKKDAQIESINDSTVNRIRKLRKKQMIRCWFKAEGMDKFDYRVLMHDSSTEVDEEITDKFKSLTHYIKFRFDGDDESNNFEAVFNDVRQQMLTVCDDEVKIVDVLIKRLFDETKTDKKRAFWTIYGDIVYENVKKNVNTEFVMCVDCGRRFFKNNQLQKRCSVCSVGHAKHKRKTEKYLICRDCHEEFVVKSSNNRTVRCPKCQKNLRQNAARKCMRKKRERE